MFKRGGEKDARLTDIKKKKIIADYLELGSYNAVAKLNDVSNKTVKRIVDECPEMSRNVQLKKEQNTADILRYMESQRDIVCSIIGKGLKVLNDEDKLREAAPSQITTALGTLIDKWASISENSEQETAEDGLSKSLRELAEEMENYEQD